MPPTHIIRVTHRKTGEVVFDIDILEGGTSSTADPTKAQRRAENVSEIRAGLLRERVGTEFDVDVVLAPETPETPETARERHLRLQVLSNRVADVFGLDRTVSRNVAEMHVAYKRHAFAYTRAKMDDTVAQTLGLGGKDYYVTIQLPRGATVPVPDCDRIVAVGHLSDSDVLTVALPIRPLEQLPPVDGHPEPRKEKWDRWEAWVARWLATRYPAIEAEIVAYRTPAKPYASSWDALMPALQAWMATDKWSEVHIQDFWLTLAQVCRGKVEAIVGPTMQTLLGPSASLAFALATPEDVCNAVIATAGVTERKRIRANAEHLAVAHAKECRSGCYATRDGGSVTGVNLILRDDCPTGLAHMHELQRLGILPPPAPTAST